ncbi:lipase family protein [Sciscionella marina]|uniref:lipase family protein n=1 Tax=Sciscionella marina TaxID=508770 RepID=UPI0003711312|nr:lipase family protein [Sciscionella marina]
MTNALQHSNLLAGNQLSDEVIGLWKKLLAACTAAVAALGVCALPAAAQQGDFYTPPDPVPAGHNGDLLRSEPMNTLPPSGAKTTRLMYHSTDAAGKPIAVTGTYFAPKAPWKGKGERPLVDLAVGTIGQGDQCAPSKLFEKGISLDGPGGPIVEYEWLMVGAMLAKGYAVVVTDYEGLGTPGTHTYVNRADEAHAVLDAARAVQRLPESGIGKDNPIGMWGYSQGGGAVAAAAESAREYAPELAIKGTYAGAPPADLRATLKTIDGTILSGAIGYALNGFEAQYPEIKPLVDSETNAKGKEMLNRVGQECVVATGLSTGFQKTKDFTRTGEPLSAVLDRYPIAKQILDEQKIGNREPNAPVMLASNVNDDLVPYPQVAQLAKDWKAKGASVKLESEPLPPLFPGTALGHIAPWVIGSPVALDWLGKQLTGSGGAE